MEKEHLITVDDNWAIFVTQNSKVEWFFGNPSTSFIEHTVNFLKGLSNISKEIFGEESVASIEFDVKQRSGTKASEVFIVSLENQFFFLCSDPATTLKLITAKSELPHAIAEQISAILVGQASILFAHSITSAKDKNEEKIIEKHFQNLILDINPNLINQISTICSQSSSNFSILDFNELILFHYFIRKHKELTDHIVPSGWVLVSNLSGGDLPFSWNVEKDVILAGYLAVIIGFIETLFRGAKPRRLVFGTHEIRKLDFLYGKEYFLAIDSSFMHLIQDENFLPSFMEINPDVFNDLHFQLKDFIINETVNHVTCLLEDLEIESLFNAYQGLSDDMQLSFKEKLRKIILKLF